MINQWCKNNAKTSHSPISKIKSNQMKTKRYQQCQFSNCQSKAKNEP